MKYKVFPLNLGMANPPILPYYRPIASTYALPTIQF